MSPKESSFEVISAQEAEHLQRRWQPRLPGSFKALSPSVSLPQREVHEPAVRLFTRSDKYQQLLPCCHTATMYDQCHSHESSYILQFLQGHVPNLCPYLHRMPYTGIGERGHHFGTSPHPPPPQTVLLSGSHAKVGGASSPSRHVISSTSA